MQALERNVLIVDDDADTRANVSDILTDEGYQTATASDGPAALELVRGQRYDIALLDFTMPRHGWRNPIQIHPKNAA